MSQSPSETTSTPSDASRVSWRRRVVDLAWPGHPGSWAEVPAALRPTLVMVARLTIAAVIAFVITQQLTNGELDLTGPLTALLVLQASAYSTLRMGLVRIGAVLGGVLVATLLSTWIGLTWWSLGAAIAAALLVGKVFRLGDQALETPISAMLILAVTNPDVAAQTRVLNTLIGAGVGMIFGLLFPTAMQTPAARRSVTKVADAVAAPLTEAGEELARGPLAREQVDRWIDQARLAPRAVADAGDRLSSLREGRRLNPRALATTDVGPVLSSALDTLERCLLAVRALFVALREEIPEGEHPEDPYGEELRQAVAVVLGDAGDCLRAFAGLVDAEVAGEQQGTEQALADNLEIMRETQAILTELILVDAAGNTSAWLLRGSILTALGRVLAELDLEERVRAYSAWQQTQSERASRQLPGVIQAALPHPERPYPRAVDQVLVQLRRARTAQPYSSRWPPDLTENLDRDPHDSNG